MTDMFDRNVYKTVPIPDDWEPMIGERIAWTITESSPYIYYVKDYNLQEDGDYALTLVMSMSEYSYRILITASELRARSNVSLLVGKILDPHFVEVYRDAGLVSLGICTVPDETTLTPINMTIPMARILACQLTEALKQDANKPGPG